MGIMGHIWPLSAYVGLCSLFQRFLDLSSGRLLVLLGEDDLHIDREEIVFEAVRRWATARNPQPEQWMVGSP